MTFAIYQQSARGNGKLVRSIKLANVLFDLGESRGILFYGRSEQLEFEYPNGLEIVSLPPIEKGLAQSYSSTENKHDLKTCLANRSKIMRESIESLDPDFFFVDTIPTGVCEELKEIIISLKKSDSRVKIILICRDVIGGAVETVTEWEKYGIYQILESYFDAIFICGHPSVFRFEEEYEFSNLLRRKTVYCNYFSQEFFLPTRRKFPYTIEYLVTVGGGIDGYALISEFLDLYEEYSPTGKSVIVLGSQFPEGFVKNVIDRCPSSVEVIASCPSLVPLLVMCETAVTMGGFNTVTELIALGKHPYIFPRLVPNSEQLIRARRLETLGLATKISSGDGSLRRVFTCNSTPKNISKIDFPCDFREKFELALRGI